MFSIVYQLSEPSNGSTGKFTNVIIEYIVMNHHPDVGPINFMILLKIIIA